MVTGHKAGRVRASGERKQLSEVEVAVFTVDCDATEGAGAEHICPMAWTVDPACHGTLDRVHLPVVICDIFTEAAFVKRNFVATLVETIVADRNDSIRHRHTVFHRDVV